MTVPTTYRYSTVFEPPDSDLPPLDADTLERFRRHQDEMIADAFGIPADMLNNACTNSTASEAAISGEEILHNMKEAMRNLEEAGAKIPPRVELIESVDATEQGPRIRTYPRRRAKSASHWRRMDKKWMKRYGFQRIPSSYQYEYNMLGARRIVVVVHPILRDHWKRSGQFVDAPPLCGRFRL